jgi:arylsulfatase A-like enzyme
MTPRARIAVAAAALALAGIADAQTRPPNIVVIVADDMGYGDIGAYGGKDIPTPNVDALANAGVRFTDAYVSAPVCSPTRAGLLTGRYQERFGHEFNIGMVARNTDFGLALDERTIADRLKAAGYRTALVGKWHLGFAPQFYPMERGFDEFFGFLAGAHSYMSPAAASPNPVYDGRTPVREMAYLTDALADRAVELIHREKARPFFLYLAFNAVHVPMHATEKYLARFAHIADRQRRTYAAMLSAMDDGIGRTLAALREENLDEHTLVFFFSDNGGPTSAGGVNGSTNGPLRGTKGQTYEGGIRVPFIIRWTGQVPAGKTDPRPIIQLDVLPTALAAAGVPIPSDWRLDGVNLLPFLTGGRADSPHEALYWRSGAMMAIRREDWKLVKVPERRTPTDTAQMPDLSGAELYNVREDIGETTNRAAARPDKVKELAEAWQRWNKELAPPRWPPPAALRETPE